MAKKPTYEELEHRIQELEKAEFEVKQAKEALLEREAENRFHSQLLKAVEQAVVATDLQGHVIYWNNFAEKLFGWPHKDALGKTTIELIATKSSVEQGENIMEELRQGKSWSGECLCHHRNGTEIPIFVTNSPIHDENGKLIGIIGVSTDITERKQAEEALRTSEEKFKNLFDNMNSGVAVYTAENNGKDFIFHDINKAVEQIEKISKEKIIGRSVLEMFPAVKVFGLFDVFQRVWKTGKPEHHSIAVYKDERITGWRDNFVYKLPSGEIVAVYSDETKRKQAEEALRQAYNIINRSPTVVFVWKNAEGWPVEFVSDNVVGLFGHTAEEFTSGKVSYATTVHPDDLERVAQEVITYSKEEDRKEFSHDPYRIITKNGEIKWLDDMSLIRRDEKGDITHYEGIVLDISDKKQAEIEKGRFQSQLKQSQKMEAIGTLAGGIAHDYNNLLAIIMGNLSMVQENTEPHSDMAELLHEIEQASSKARDLTHQLMTLSQGGYPKKEWGSIESLLKAVQGQAQAYEGIEYTLSIQDDLWPVEFDSRQMHYAISNVLTNAVEAMPQGGKIAIETKNQVIEDKSKDSTSPLNEGKYVKISIKDEGRGIPEKHLNRIFDPYFSTKERGAQKGMGLGLATTYAIVEKHGGHIMLNSTTGVGTTATIYLPVAVERRKRQRAKHKSVDIAPSISSGQATIKKILVMDDEESLRILAQKMLERLGHEVETVKDGVEAIETYKKHIDSGEPFDAVILDLTIKGGMGGAQAIKELIKIDPGVNAIVCSGYFNDPVLTKHEEHGFRGAMAKPYQKADLESVLKKVMG